MTGDAFVLSVNVHFLPTLLLMTSNPPPHIVLFHFRPILSIPRCLRSKSSPYSSPRFSSSPVFSIYCLFPKTSFL